MSLAILEHITAPTAVTVIVLAAMTLTILTRGNHEDDPR